MATEINGSLSTIPIAARRNRFPVGGTLILILWQHVFAWPTWIYAILWTCWVLICLAVIVERVKTAGDIISDAKWREVFK